MKVLIADKFPEQAVDELSRLGYTVVYDPGLEKNALVSSLGLENPEVLVVRSTKVSGEMIRAGSNLTLVIRAGAGYNTIDLDTASSLSVFVANCPGKNAIAVAELTMGLILSIDRRIPHNVKDLWNGRWDKKEYSKAEGLFGKTLGIIGVGTIGIEVISRARAFGLAVIAHSRSLTAEKAERLGIFRCASILEVASRADIISVHIALDQDTKDLINADFFAAMKEGSCFINTSRAEVVDEKALLDAVATKGIRVGLDVFSDEPSAKSGEYNGMILNNPMIYGTHHIGASTAQAQFAVAKEAVDIIEIFRRTGTIQNCVNLLDRTPAKFVISVRHRNRVGVLSEILNIIRTANINVESMENIIFRGGEGACANIQIDEALPDDEPAKMLAASSDIHSAIIKPIA